MALFYELKRNGFTGEMLTKTVGGVRRKNTEIDFIRYSKDIWLIQILNDNI